jgi:hypothetical protein
MHKNWFKLAFLNLIIIAIIGVLLRYAFVGDLDWFKFTNFKHAHSHVAMLGWVYLALYPMLIEAFIPKQKHSKKYSVVFWLTELSVIGMLFGFALTGYKSISIAFSTMHMLLAYLFVYYLFRDSRKNLQVKHASGLFFRSSLLFMLLSSLAIWGMIPLILMGLQGEAIYYWAIQFFLHFQFNGWFIFAIIGIFLHIVEKQELETKTKLVHRFFWLLTISCFLTYALAITWSNPAPWLFAINGLGVTLQLAACIISIKYFLTIRKQLKSLFKPIVAVLLALAFGAFILKILVQTAVIVPSIAEVGYTVRNFVISFLHLMLLGLVTTALFGFAAYFKYLQFEKSLTRSGLIIFITGVITTEFLLVLQGVLFWMSMGFLPQYYIILTAFTLLLPVGAILIYTEYLFPKKSDPASSKTI